MLDMEKYLASNNLEMDELGRIIIDDEAILEKINGAVMMGNDIWLSDAACGNSNCLC